MNGPYLVSSVRITLNGDVFLDIGAAAPEQTMTIFIPSTSASQFSPNTFRLKWIFVRGVIADNEGSPQIVVTMPSQIRLRG